MTNLSNDVHLETLETRSIDETDAMLCTASKLSWMDLIIKCLKSEELPNDLLTTRKVKCQAPRYILVEKKLYKRSHSFPLLTCLPSFEVDYALRKVHEKIYGNHLEGRALSYKILWQGYYWPTMQEEVIQYTKRCDSYQHHASVQHQLATELTPLSSPWPFAQ